MTPTSPPVVAFIRALFLTVAAAALAAGALFITDNSAAIGDAWWAPFILLGLRTLEGFVDKARGQVPQAGALGSRPADPGAYLGK